MKQQKHMKHNSYTANEKNSDLESGWKVDGKAIKGGNKHSNEEV